MKKKLVIFFLVMLTGSITFAGLNEDYHALNQQFMKKRMAIRSRADMNKLMAVRVVALKNLLIKYKDVKLVASEQLTKAEILMSMDDLVSAWDVLKTISKPADSEKYNAMCARALFGMKENAKAESYLNKLNRQGQFYGMVSFGRGMSLLKEEKGAEAIPYLKNVLGVVTLKDVYRAYAIHGLADIYEDTGRHGETMKLLSKFSKDSTLSGRTRLELTNIKQAMAKVGQPAVNVQSIVRGFNGRAPIVSREKGKVIVLDFFAPWCAPCRAAIPNLSKLYLKYRDKGLDVIGVTTLYGYYADGKVRKQNITAKTEAELLAGFAKAQKATYPMLLLGEQDTMQNYAVTGLPHVVIIGKKGVIRRVFTGMYSKNSFEEALKKLLAEKKE